MLESYKATLRGDKIEWASDAPQALHNNKSVEVFITILEDAENGELRPFGLSKGDFVVPEDFDSPLPEEILASFEQ